MFKLNFFRKSEVTREERREAGYKDAAAILVRTGDQQRVEGMMGGPYLNFHGFVDPYDVGARDALYDYRRRRLEVIDACREFFTNLEAS